MVVLEQVLDKYDVNGEKSGWTFLTIPLSVAHKIKPNTRKSFRVKGSLDATPIKQLALIPIGGGDFILPINNDIRKTLKKELGHKVLMTLEEDTSVFEFSADFLACLEDVPEAMEYFKTLTPSHQRYFSKWIESAKSIETKSKRISNIIFGLSNSMGYPETIRHFKGK